MNESKKTKQVGITSTRKKKNTEAINWNVFVSCNQRERIKCFAEFKGANIKFCSSKHMKAWRFGFPIVENDMHLIRLKRKKWNEILLKKTEKIIQEQNNRVRRRCCYELIIIIKHERVCGGFYCRSRCAWDLRLLLLITFIMWFVELIFSYLSAKDKQIFSAIECVLVVHS